MAEAWPEGPPGFKGCKAGVRRSADRAEVPEAESLLERILTPMFRRSFLVRVFAPHGLRGNASANARKVAAVPVDDGGGFHDLHRSSPALPHARQQHPHESVGSAEMEPFWRRLLEDRELVAEGEDLRCKFGSSSEATANRRKKGDEAWTHEGARYQQKTLNSIATRSTAFSVGTHGVAVPFLDDRASIEFLDTTGGIGGVCDGLGERQV
jgi:hypothetical protein